MGRGVGQRVFFHIESFDDFLLCCVLEVLHGYCIDGLSHGNRVHDDRHSLGHLLSAKRDESTLVTAPV